MTTTDLYREITGDKQAHHRTITAAIARQSKARRVTVLLYAAGLHDRAVGDRTGKAHGAARGMLVRTMRTAHKAIHKLPRYHVHGRAKVFQGNKAAAAHAIATKAAEPSEQPQGFRAFLTPTERARL